MSKRKYKAEEIIGKLREVELLINQGHTLISGIRQIGVSEQTYYRWRKQYGGLQLEQAKKFKGLEVENARLKKLVAELSLDNAVLKRSLQKTSKPDEK